ncbi:hypothetical protein [Nocardia sp. R7R-8]|uniref:hypothetical protein n=1 Tax=Nocardia sp. R7R-8 TaxID=3459304 RepID=UPI00403E1DCE
MGDGHTQTAAVGTPSGAQKSTGPSAEAGGGRCVDSTSKNLSFQDLIDLGLSSDGYRSMMEPILVQVPSGNYAKFVTAVCSAAWSSGQGTDLSPHGALAKLATETCLSVNGSKTAEEMIQRYASAVEGNPALADWETTYFHALADYFCPQQFRK